MTNKLPSWARELLARNPEATVPTPENPMPAWLEAEFARVPL